jgi:DNA (cytosine-5)-methyltransferase 1
MGWKPIAFSEIEKFPSQVLAHHYPDVPNLGDMTKYKEWVLSEPIDILVGGTPCQSFSVAGLRKGLDDPRGNLALTYVGILDKFRPKWCIWENVPGVLSSGGGRDFGSFLGALGEVGYGWAYRVLDAQYFGVPQRRRRVFVVGCLGDWKSAAEVLFDSHSLSWNTKKGRKTRERVAYPIADSVGTLCARDYKGINSDDAAGGGKLIMTKKISPTLQTSCNDYSRADGFTMMVYENHPSDSRVEEMGDVCQTVTSSWGTGGGNVPFVQNVAYGFEPGITKREGNPNRFTKEISPTLRAEMGDNQVSMANSMAVRRLTPVECERLQGFPDNYTNIKENCPDGARYKALGNSMAVPVMRWIGERINTYETMRSKAVVQVEAGVGFAEV